MDEASEDGYRVVLTCENAPEKKTKPKRHQITPMRTSGDKIETNNLARSANVLKTLKETSKYKQQQIRYNIVPTVSHIGS